MSHADEQFRRRTQQYDHPPPAGGGQPSREIGPLTDGISNGDTTRQVWVQGSIGEPLLVGLLAVLIAAVTFAALVALAAAYGFARADEPRSPLRCSEICSFARHEPPRPANAPVDGKGPHRAKRAALKEVER